MWKGKSFVALIFTTFAVFGVTTFSIAQGNQPEQTSTSALIRFAAIGDFGSGNNKAVAVATLVGGWQPDSQSARRNRSKPGRFS